MQVLCVNQMASPGAPECASPRLDHQLASTPLAVAALAAMSSKNMDSSMLDPAFARYVLLQEDSAMGMLTWIPRSAIEHCYCVAL